MNDNPYNLKEVEETIRWLHTTLDSVYGSGYSHNHPAVVAAFMQSITTKELLNEIRLIRCNIARYVDEH